MSSDQSPISVVAALRISSKGKLRYDRHWTERDTSKERVLKEVTEKKESNLISNVELEKSGDKAQSPNVPSPSATSSGGTAGRRSRRDPLVVLSPLNRSLDKSARQSPVVRSPVTPVSVTIKRSEERNVVDPRNVVMSGQKPESPSNNNSLNYSLNLSRSLALEESNSSVLSYDTPDVIKYQKYPRVDLKKIRVPDSFIDGDISNEESDSLDVLDISSHLDEGNAKTSPERSFKGQSSVEEQLMFEMQKRMEDAGRRVEQRSAEWEAKRKQEENACKEQLESLKESFRVEKEKLFNREIRDLEDMVGQMIIIQQQERESKQQELIVLARKEEQLAKEKLERKKRMGEQMEKFAPLQNKIQENLNKVLQVWNSVDDKSFFSPALVQTVPKISQLSRSLLEEGRNKVVKGECSDSILDQLNTLNHNLEETTRKIEDDKTRIQNEKVAEEEKAKQLLLKQQDEDALKAAQAQAAAASQQPVTVAQQQPQQPQHKAAQPPALPIQPQAPTPAQSSAQPPHPLGQINDSVSLENKAWYDSIIKFKSDFIKNVVFTDAEKQFKFDLQRAVNTPLNSLSGVSSAHLQDKVDKLVQLLSGAQVTVGERAVSVTQHQHARSFCLGLAAKKLAKQGEDVVSSDSKSAFPAATFALAIWEKFPEFGTLLIAYMFEMCPFLVPFHPLQTAGQTDKEHYLQLGYKYDGDTIEKQDKYLKRMSGLARLYAALSVSHLPKASSSLSHPHPPARVWSWFSSVLNLTPHTDITASLMLDILEVTGNTMFAKYGKQFCKLLQLVKSKYFPKLEAVKSEGGPTVRLDQFLSTAIRGQSIREPDGCLKPGFL